MSEKQTPTGRCRGAAGMHLELSDSRITVRHASSNEVLLEGAVVEGAWDRIWAALYTEMELGVLNHEEVSRG